MKYLYSTSTESHSARHLLLICVFIQRETERERGEGGQQKQGEKERRQRRNVGRGGEEGEHRVCASGTRRQGKIAWARLAGRVCLCLIEEGCETETPHWLGFTGMLPRRDGH